LSVRQPRDPRLPEIVQAGLARHHVPAWLLEPEITESMLMEPADGHAARKAAVRQIGVSMAIDDFGTGCPSQACPSRLDIDKLTIDRSFVRSMLQHPSARAVAMAVIALRHTPGLAVVAEGVERHEQAALLRQARCDELQGCPLARPMPARALQRWLREPFAPALPAAG
jgi:EAL domain-containing protein (putative c-di-GMP-specific phosphodiesterase class I)